MRWGLLPATNWTPELARRYINTNARAETLLGVPSFAPSMSQGYRCVVPLSAFFEWRTEGGQKVKYRVSRRDGKPLLAAGLYSPDGRLGRLPVPSCTIVTRPANADLHELHDRMPVLLFTADLFGWMNRRAPAHMAQEIALKSFPEGVLQYSLA